MSEVSNYQGSRASSLSIFSGLGTSSFSGSESGVNVEELSDEQLARVVEDLRSNVKRLAMETKMFEGYFERLVHSKSGDVSRYDSRKGSTASQISGSEGDSRPTTADVSIQGTRRRRSGSKTSLAGKSLKITTEVKVLIANKELQIVEKSLKSQMKHIEKAKTDGQSQIEERALALREKIKAKDRLVKALDVAVKTQKDGKKKYDPDLVYKCLENEVVYQKRSRNKLVTKNEVLNAQLQKIVIQMNQLLIKKELTGPVDLVQVHLENSELIKQIQDKNVETIGKRKSISKARKTKTQFQEVLKAEEKKMPDLIKLNSTNAKTLNRLTNSIPRLTKQVEHQKGVNQRLQRLLTRYDPPSVDTYLALKICHLDLSKKEEADRRKMRIEKLRRVNEKTQVKLKRQSKKKRKHTIRMPSPSAKDNIFRGLTFDIKYNLND